MEITLPAINTANTSNPYIFLKEISTNGDVNTIDVVYPTSTILGVMSPDWIKYLLEPVAKFCESPAWTAKYVVHDLGSKPDPKNSLIFTADIHLSSLSRSSRTYDQHFREDPSRSHRQLPHNGVPIPTPDQRFNLGPIALQIIPTIRRLPQNRRPKPLRPVRHRRLDPPKRQPNEPSHHLRHRPISLRSSDR